jgi:hypothetical protein
MSDWVKYANKLSKINQRAGEVFQKLIEKNGVDNFNATVEYAKAVIDRYGEASSALTAQMYDELANIQNANVQQAQPATIAKKDEIIGAFKKVQDIARMRSSVERFVKLASADTMLKNAQRDGAEWAWVAIGDTCPFCIMLASQGWVKASKKVIKGDHARHIHAHCDCEFIVRFDGETTIKGYDPDKFSKMYQDAKGNNYKEKINAMRREKYADIKDERNARRREIYQEKKENVTIKNPFIDPITPLEISNQKQNKHILGTKEYLQYKKIYEEKGEYGPSIIEISKEECHNLVDKFHGKGIVRTSKIGKIIPEEIIVTNDKEIGTVIDNRTGKQAKTSVFKIHYSNEGTHISPDYPSKKGR